jgi:hypothetical protein
MQKPKLLQVLMPVKWKDFISQLGRLILVCQEVWKLPYRLYFIWVRCGGMAQVVESLPKKKKKKQEYVRSGHRIKRFQ